MSGQAWRSLLVAVVLFYGVAYVLARLVIG